MGERGAYRFPRADLMRRSLAHTAMVSSAAQKYRWKGMTMNTCASGADRSACVSLLLKVAIVASALTGVAGAASTVSIASSNSATDIVDAKKPTLESIALSPLTFAAMPGTTQQLTVTGTFRDGQTAALNASKQTFTSSNSAIATVSAEGVVTVTAGALVGGTATIGVTNIKTGISAMSDQTTVVTSTTPSPNSVAAAIATASDNALCGNTIAPFYWEIGDQNGTLVTGSLGTTATGPITGSTLFSVDSASKLLYAAYVVQERGAASNLSAADIDFLHFASGYTYLPLVTATSVCPLTLSPDTVNECLTQKTPAGILYSAQNPATVGKFDYDGGHMENHASQLMTIGNTDFESLGPIVSAQLGTGISFVYTEPLMSGGVETSASMYGQVLRNILSVSSPLAMNDALGTSPVCTLPSSTCNAVYTPFPQEAWSYSIGHWVEDNPATNGDGAFNSAGSYGFYPWIDATKSYYGIVARDAANGAYPSVQCGRLIRAAFITGVQQTGPLPME